VKSRAYENSPEKPLCELLTKIQGVTANLPSRDTKRLSRGMRTHWAIENRVHWVLDVAMGEDTKRTRAGERAPNLAVIRKLALHLLRRETTVPTGIAAKQKRAGWDHNYLLRILAQT
jgi:hypothetical protein